MNNELDYFQPYQENDVVYSCDMLYLKFRYNDSILHCFFQNQLDSINSIVDINYFESKDLYKYRHLFVLTFGKYKVVVKFQLQKEHVGVIEFNPNKLHNQDGFNEFYFNFINCLYSIEFYKMDFAIDIHVCRDLVHVYRDNRKYSKFVSGSVTEYLGCRNKHNHVKVYDKSYESNLSYDLTRIEITIENGIPINYPNIKIMLPEKKLDLSNLKPKEVFVIGMLCEVEEPFEHLRKLQKRDRKKYEELLSNVFYDFERSDSAFLQVLFAMRDFYHFTTDSFVCY